MLSPKPPTSIPTLDWLWLLRENGSSVCGVLLKTDDVDTKLNEDDYFAKHPSHAALQAGCRREDCVWEILYRGERDAPYEADAANLYGDVPKMPVVI